MVKDLSPAELSTLWLLHDRHTNRHAVEKAIELGLPLWKEAVHLARACHRSNMDLAGGAYYVVGSDFVDNEDSSQYAYHEIGRYPDVIRNPFPQNMNSGEHIREERSNSDIDTASLLYPSTSHEKLLHSSTPMSVDDARDLFESDRNKHIQLLLGGVSSTELENFQSEKSSLEICEISDDNESLCTRSCVETSATPVSEEANDVTNESFVVNEAENRSVHLVSEKPRSQEETSESLADFASMRSAFDHINGENYNYDFSILDAQMPCFCEVPFTPPTRNLVRMDRMEFERRLMSENELLREEKRSTVRSKSSCGDSEIEDSHRSTVMEIDDAVSQLAPDIEMNEVISKLMKEDVSAEFSDAGTPSRRSKRHYVEPFDGDSSMAGSEFSDTNIDVNILYEISELRREEGASSPSNCSIDSDDATPPDICVWHPQSWTYNIDLITYFRSPSPLEEAVAVLVPKEYVELTVAAPEYEEANSSVELSKKLPHSGAFTRKRGGRCVEVSFNIPAPKSEETCLDCNVDNLKQECKFCEIEYAISCLEEVAQDFKASSDESCVVDCHINSINQVNECCQVVLVDSHQLCASLDTKAAKDEFCLLDCHISNEKQETQECSVEREDHHSAYSYLHANASTTESSSLHLDVHKVTKLSQSCQIEMKDRHIEIVSFVAKAATLVEVASEKSCESKLSSEDCVHTHWEPLHSTASFSCKVPVYNDVGTSQAFTRNRCDIDGCSAIFTDIHYASTSFDCSVPKCENISTYWVFDILLGNSAVIVLKDKSVRRSTHFYKVRGGHAKRKPLSVDDPAKRRKRDDSLNEVLLLLEAGAMPSQYIETSPPRSSSSSRGSSRLRTRGRKESNNSSKDGTFIPQPVDVITISPEKRLDMKTSNAERASASRSEASDLSDSPDRLVICEDEDIIVQEDPVKVIQNLQDSSYNIAVVQPKALPPSRDVSTKIGTTVPDQVPSGAEVAPNRRSLRRRVTEPVQTAVVRKRSVKERSENISKSKSPEDNTKVDEAKPVHRDLKDDPVLDCNKSLKRMGRLSEARVVAPPPPTHPPIPKSMKKVGSITCTPDVTERKRSPRLANAQQASAGALVDVVRDHIKTPSPETSVAKASTASLAVVQGKSENRVKTQRKPEKITTALIAPTMLCLESGLTSTSTPHSNSLTRITKREPSPIIEKPKELSTESTAAFVAIPRKASVAVQFSTSYMESVSFKCFACPAKATRSFEQFDFHIDTGLDILAEVAVSSAPHCSRAAELENLRAQTASGPANSLSSKKGRGRNTSAAEVLPSKAEKPFLAAAVSSGVQPDKGSSTNTDVTHTSDRNLVAAAKSAIERSNEKRRHSKRFPESELVDQRPKRRKTSAAETIDLQKGTSVEKSVGKASATAQARLVEDISTRLTRRRTSTLAAEGKGNSYVSADDNTESVVPASVEIRKEVTPKPCKRRKTMEPEISLKNTSRRADSTKGKVACAARLDTEVPPIPPKRRKTSNEMPLDDSAPVIVDTHQGISTRKSSRLSIAQPVIAPSLTQAEARRRTTATCSSAQNVGSDDEVMFVESGLSRRRRKSLTPPLLVVAVEFTSTFVPVKRDNNRSADPITLTTCNRGETVSLTVHSSDSAEVLNALALDIIIGEASSLSAVNLATFAQFVLNLFDPVTPIFAPLDDVEPSTLPANFTTIFERSTPLQFRHRLDYNSFNSMLLNRLPENGLHALTLDLPKVSMLKITKFVDIVKEAVEEICDELRTRKTLSKAEIKKEIDLSGEVQQLITSRYVETMMKMADACSNARDVPIHVIADRFHLLLCGWTCFLQQGGVLRVRLQLCPGRSHPGIVDITTAWLDQIDTVLSRAQATKSMRTSAFAVSLAQEKTIVSKVWYQMASHTSTSCEDRSYIFCEECKLYFRNEDTDFIHNRVFHQKSRECEECYDMFHTLLGLDLHMVGSHKRNFAADL